MHQMFEILYEKEKQKFLSKRFFERTYLYNINFRHENCLQLSNEIQKNVLLRGFYR